MKGYTLTVEPGIKPDSGEAVNYLVLRWDGEYAADLILPDGIEQRDIITLAARGLELREEGTGT